MTTQTLPLSEESTRKTRYFDQKQALFLASLVLLFLLALLIRIKDIQAPGILVEREYTSAIFARDYYLEHTDSDEAWRESVAHITKERQAILEPPVTEFLVSLVYRLAGREDITYARYLTSAFWLIGGIFMFLITRKLVNVSGAWFATAYYLMLPMGVLVSRSFQPDSLMMMMFLTSLFSILKYFDRPSQTSLILAAFMTSVTLLLRPLVIFALFGAFIALTINKERSWKAFFDRPFLVFCLVGLALPAAYYGYGIFLAGFMHWKLASSFRPYLFLTKVYWREWFLIAVQVIGYSGLITALLGFSLLRRNVTRALIIGLVFGYFVFGLFFTFHIHTHGYYHIQLIPAVALSAASLFSALIEVVGKSNSRFKWLPIGVAVMLPIGFGFLQVRDRLYTQVFEDPILASEVGNLVNHSDQTVFVAYHYGLPLEYYGELSGAFWPKSITYWFYREPEEQMLSVQERLQSLGFTPQYFIITNFAEYNQQHQDLADYLEQNCQPLVQTEKYLIYHTCVH